MAARESNGNKIYREIKDRVDREDAIGSARMYTRDASPLLREIQSARRRISIQ